MWLSLHSVVDATYAVFPISAATLSNGLMVLTVSLPNTDNTLSPLLLEKLLDKPIASAT